MHIPRPYLLFTLLIASWPLSTNGQENVPQGTVTRHSISNKPFEWVEFHRDYHVYVPVQYDGSTPAALMVFQDGHSFADKESAAFNERLNVPALFDKLIAEHLMPVTIGLFVNPGHIDKNYPDNLFECSKRSEEYDELSDRYVSFLIDELIPKISQNYHLSDDPEQRAIAGFSSGGVCAFTAAWQRPDYFHRVLSFSGSFTNIRGAHNYPYLVRSTPRKNLKVYLQSGTNDLNILFGNWWLANQQMASALEFKGYDYKFTKTTGQHGEFMADHLEEALVWLWDDDEE